VDGTVRMTIPAGIQSGETLRLRGLGLPGLHGRGRGDQLVRIRVWTPRHLSKDQERVLRELKAMETPPPRGAESGEEKGFWTKFKEVFS
jgi:molecular chaperone DnaJ